ncbi:MAG: hypothetical protein WCS15_06625 [Prevotella sp.]
MNCDQDPTESMWEDYDYQQNTGELSDWFDDDPSEDEPPLSNENDQYMSWANFFNVLVCIIVIALLILLGVMDIW